MGRVGSADVDLFMAGGYNLLGSITDMDVGPKEAVLERADVMGDEWEKHEDTHNRKAGLRIVGFYGDGANDVQDALVALAQQVVMLGLEGNIAGKRFVGYQGATPTYSRRPARGELTKYEARYQPTGLMEEGMIIHPLAGYSTPDPFLSTAQDNGSLSSAGGSGYVEVSGLTLGGYTSLLYKIRHSTDNISYADLITFAAVTTSPTAERKTVAGTVNRWIRGEGDWQGAGAGQSVTLASGFVRN